MSQQVINVGSAPNDGQGDPIRTAFIKTNENFTELYALPNPTPPNTLVGAVGDSPGMYAYDPDYFYYCFASYNGSNIIWAQVAQIDIISTTSINNGTSNVNIPAANSNITISANGTNNVAVFSSNVVTFLNNFSAQGNVISGGIKTNGYYYANGAPINLAGSYSNANVGAYLPTFGGNLTAGNILTNNYLYANGAPFVAGNYSNANVGAYLPTYSGALSAANITTTGNITSANNITATNFSASGNVAAQGIISATGNIVTAGYFVGLFAGSITGNISVGGANTQILFNTDGNVDAVGGLTFVKGPNTLGVLGNISAQGNVQGNYFLGDGSQLTNLPGVSYGNSNVAAYLPTYSGLLGGTLTTAVQSNITTIGIQSALSVTGAINSGNIVAGNINAVSVSVTGNAISGNVISVGIASITQTISGGNLVSNGYISATGNITGNYIIGNFVGNVANAVYATSAGTAVSSNTAITAGTVTTNAQPNITSVGTLSSLSVTANAVVGNLISTGNVSITQTITTGNLATNGYVSALGNIIGGNLNLSSAAGNITAHDITAGGNIVASGTITTSGTFRLPSYTTSQIANLTAAGGDMVYNTDLQTIQGYQFSPVSNVMGWVSWTVATYQ
jgi:hypothetical protein